jgi:hypothetical protein
VGVPGVMGPTEWVGALLLLVLLLFGGGGGGGGESGVGAIVIVARAS